MILILTGNFTDKDAEIVIQDFQDRENGNLIPKRINKIEKGNPRKEAIIKRSGITQAYLSFGLRTAPAKILIRHHWT